MYFIGCDTLGRCVERVFDDFTEGAKNLFHWFLIIWCDRQWDHLYLTKILHHKLERMEKYFQAGKFYENQEKDAENMKICVDALKRIMDDNYDDIAFAEHDKKWGKLDMKFCDRKDGEEYAELTFSRPNAVTEEQKEIEHNEYKIHALEAEKMREDDLDLLFGTMRKELLRWWE